MLVNTLLVDFQNDLPYPDIIISNHTYRYRCTCTIWLSLSLSLSLFSSSFEQCWSVLDLVRVRFFFTRPSRSIPPPPPPPLSRMVISDRAFWLSGQRGWHCLDWPLNSNTTLRVSTAYKLWPKHSCMYYMYVNLLYDNHHKWISLSLSLSLLSLVEKALELVADT